MSKIIKRSGTETQFDKDKVVQAIKKANEEIPNSKRLSVKQINDIALYVQTISDNTKRALSVEEIQNIIEDEMMKLNAFELVRAYITYRYKRELIRKSNTTDEQILALIENDNEEVKQENSNKNPIIVSTQRDYMAGEVSKDLTKRFFLPKEIVEAHEKGMIHFHDMDYFAQHIHNCDLVNLEDMLNSGTVISGTLIEKPHSFSTACNIATQIVAQVASSQYGGQTITLSHLAPFVDVSRQKLRKEVIDELTNSVFIEDTQDALFVHDGQINKIVEDRLKEEIKRGVQMIQYQINTLQTTNGQTPFVTVFMYLNEAKSEQTKKDLALVIEEVIKQRTQGVKNDKGIWITPAFPKLIYVLEDDNVEEGQPYYYLTKLAAVCTSKRLVPDYISEKIMKELKEGNCFPSMGKCKL